jgi:hypothetical protein
MMEYEHEIWDMKHKSLHMVGSLMTVSRELSRYRLDLLGVEEVRCTKPTG